ncbi:putative DNA-binding transcriptional regulator AlpA [Paenibacillus shirakamiensis]|uniref:DNA-binding transcriptional regulator AlpA n=1 Tax=Paenibacillus shirakamiensis TaxID=1265935 RepID=A0ABS4JJ79_9BACL|nr:YhbD family protein [Paenibacillus shirakamiensis]MBP2001755.1 putative DNA-binding transcriptional regulator AlpA [Paenibacillus shirakamiensis]
MTEPLISKKELLDLTGISYGQLYRWKRKNLIPEEWFIRKSSFTGQETFFPKASILSRIDKILNMKDELSLDALADVFSPQLTEISLSAGAIIERNIVASSTLELYLTIVSHEGNFPFDQMLRIFILHKLLHSGMISLQEGTMIIETLESHFFTCSEGKYELVLTRKMGVSMCLLVPQNQEIYFDNLIKEVVRIPFAEATEELKLLLNEGGREE